ncbi:MAG: hypothetical protein ACT4O5_12110 [Gammaproteobacteria bacterium]
MKLPVLLGIDAYKARHWPAAARSCINMHAEAVPVGEKSTVALFRDEGIEAFATVTGAVRGLFAIRGVTYAVAGTSLYRISSSGAATVLGTIPGLDRVSMSGNGTQVGVVASGSLYLYNGTSVSQITVAGLLKNLQWIEFFDQFFVVGNRDGFQVSALADGTLWNSIDVAEPESSPDDLVRGIRDHRNLVLFGEESTEVWYNAGIATGMPLDRAPDGAMDVGIAARESAARIDNSVIWLAREGGGLSFRKLDGLTPARISHPGIDDALDGYATISDAFAFAYTYAGHAYYVCTFPTAGATWRYDLSTQLWQQRRSFGLNYWRPNCAVGCYGKLLVGDSLAGRIGVLSASVHTEWSDEIQWESVSAPVQSNGQMLTFNRLRLEIDAGRGLATGQGSNPLLRISWTDDDGRTFSNEYSRSMGVMGDYKREISITNMGSARSRRFRFRGSDPIPTGLIRAFAEVTPGAP